jgi:hypothetical protein
MKKKLNNNHPIYFYSFFVIAFFSFSFFIGPKFFSSNYEYRAERKNENESKSLLEKIIEPEPEIVPEVIKYVPTPKQVKAIYMSACVASTKNFREDLVKLIDETELNSLIIDIKDYTGTISFDSGLEGDAGDGCRANDMKEFIKYLHEKDIYVIGRVTVFQDSFYTDHNPDLAVKKLSDGSVWTDFKGISFIEVGAKQYWDYILDLTKKSHEIGFDEINYDYIRFPSDGNMKDIYFPFSNEIIKQNPGTGKAIALEEFFKYLHTEIEKYNKDQKNPVITSADLFGMTTTNSDDLNIGQVLERALPYFDYVAPMVYPSHYPKSFNGWADPNKVPYELILHVMTGGVDKVDALKNATTTPEWIQEKVHRQQLRPWLQDFDYGGNYDIAEVQAQIKATYDSGLNSWMLWAPSNRYTRGALESY